ncbi:hypothetical protein FBUS_08118 [Fasciolopsis buskii]|uniref:Uncharacterized protein n=1 Tax=Fasciolopsis buskii TaxID=27845 RepID=A0A8E0RM02_9TREM|nr:hypothetical protein FBUS_08118 [Fasciolopsis buski]
MPTTNQNLLSLSRHLRLFSLFDQPQRSLVSFTFVPLVLFCLPLEAKLGTPIPIGRMLATVQYVMI